MIGQNLSQHLGGEGRGEAAGDWRRRVPEWHIAIRPAMAHPGALILVLMLWRLLLLVPCAAPQIPGGNGLSQHARPSRRVLHAGLGFKEGVADGPHNP